MFKAAWRGADRYGAGPFHSGLQGFESPARCELDVTRNADDARRFTCFKRDLDAIEPARDSFAGRLQPRLLAGPQIEKCCGLLLTPQCVKTLAFPRRKEALHEVARILQLAQRFDIHPDRPEAGYGDEQEVNGVSHVEMQT